MVETQNRTLICSVVFLDIVDYSRKPVVEQIKLKDRFNALLTEALQNVAVNDRIILDTGDGAAISFLGDPEDALFVATGLRDVISAEPSRDGPRLSVRIGINLGPVRLVKDINGQPNVIGDGINVAQRVMSFAEPGQVLVSRPYHEVVSRMSEETSRLFSYEGSRTDKHIREHEVYAVGATVPTVLRKPRPAESVAETTGVRTSSFMLDRGSQTATLIKDKLRRKPRLVTTLAVLVILLLAIVSRGYREKPAVESVTAQPSGGGTAAPSPPVALRRDTKIAERAPEKAPVEVKVPSVPEKPPVPAKAPAVADTPASAPEPIAVTPPPAVTKDAPPPRVKATVPPPAPREKTKSAASTARAERKASGVGELKKPPSTEIPITAALTQPAIVTFAIAPWGEVFVDRRSHGVSPPLREIQISPGRHIVEIRNTGFQSHVETFDVNPGGRITIRHKFN